MKLALGTAQFGMDYGISNKRGKICREEVIAILDEARNSAIDMLDTANSYGCSEEQIGEYCKNKGSHFKIVTKIVSSSPREVTTMYETSLKRLRTNRVYACLLHDFKSFTKDIEIWNALQDLKMKGSVDKIGFSLYYPEEVDFLIEKKIGTDILQIPYSIFDQRFSELLPVLKKRNVEIHVRSVFLQGLFFMEPAGLNSFFDKAKNSLLALQGIARKSKVPVSALCLTFALLNEFIDKVVIGVESLSNLKENISAVVYKAEVKDLYNELLNLREHDEDIVLPTRWGKI